MIQAITELLPYVGGSISTLIFGMKQATRLRRLETFLNEVKQEINSIRDRIPNQGQDEETFLAIFEELTEKVEREQFAKKLEYFKIYFKNTLISPVAKNNYDERRFFLDILGEISPLQIQILEILFKYEAWRDIKDIPIRGIDRNVVAAGAMRLVYLGLALSQQASVGYGDMRDLANQTVKLTSFGRRFCEFCLNEV